MRAVVQRVKSSSVTVDGEVVGKIDLGLNVLLGVTHDDTEKEVDWLANKIPNLRIFPDDEGKMNRSLLDLKGSLLVISQFTLYGDCKKGRRPSFIQAARPEQGESLYENFLTKCREVVGSDHVQKGIFGAEMHVEIANWGPVTLVLDTAWV